MVGTFQEVDLFVRPAEEASAYLVLIPLQVNEHEVARLESGHLH